MSAAIVEYPPVFCTRIVTAIYISKSVAQICRQLLNNFSTDWLNATTSVDRNAGVVGSWTWTWRRFVLQLCVFYSNCAAVEEILTGAVDK